MPFGIPMSLPILAFEGLPDLCVESEGLRFLIDDGVTVSTMGKSYLIITCPYYETAGKIKNIILGAFTLYQVYIYLFKKLRITIFL